jgi:hypothetical protein
MECLKDRKRVYCGTKLPSGCITYGNGNLPAWSKLKGDEACDRLRDALNELYQKLSMLKERIDLSCMDNVACFSRRYSRDSTTVQDVLGDITGKLCSLKNRLAALGQKYQSLPECDCYEIGECD